MDVVSGEEIGGIGLDEILVFSFVWICMVGDNYRILANKFIILSAQLFVYFLFQFFGQGSRRLE